ncbi:MAG: hypothetical protein PHY47_21705 [Lachnospiraceae bacterium]|nr:hypothetical protein [Lachnospiraceae bacterium]
MNDEILILEKLLSQLANVMNVIPGEVVRMKESETILILQRRMEKSDLQQAITEYNAIFAEKNGTTLDKLKKATTAYVRIKVLVENKETDFEARSYRELIKEFKSQVVKVNNIIHLTQVNSMTADDYQKEKIELVLEKNKAFLEVFQMEIESLEKKLERMPVDEEQPAESVDISKEQSTKPERKSRKSGLSNVISSISKKMEKSQEKKYVDEQLKNVEKDQSETKCVEIPFYDKSLTFTDKIECKDIPAYVLLKRKNNIYFGMRRNVGKSSYDNRDQSLIELTEATEEFLQFMSEDLLSDEYELKIFSDKEKVGLRMYFDFVSRCFQKHIGVTLTVQEYLAFKTYYNQLVKRMFELEEKEKESYYRALILADAYWRYMESYDLECADDEGTIIKNIIYESNEGYINDLKLIIDNHIVDAGAKEDLDELIRKIREFNQRELDDKMADEVQQKLPTEVVAKAPSFDGTGYVPQMYGMPAFPVVNQGMMQIVIQILNQDREIVDEALYAGDNIRQALYDYSTKDAYIKRLGFRNNGTDVFYKEEVK